MLWIYFCSCAVGTVLHFLYEPLGRPRALAWLLPVSESPWEHYKLLFWPACAGLGTAALLCGIPWSSWVAAALCACAHGFAAMFGIYFFYTCALGVGRPVLAVDIPSYFVAFGSAWRVGTQMLLRPIPRIAAAAAVLLLAVGVCCMARWSFAPPAAPMFRAPRPHSRS